MKRQKRRHNSDVRIVEIAKLRRRIRSFQALIRGLKLKNSKASRYVARIPGYNRKLRNLRIRIRSVKRVTSRLNSTLKGLRQMQSKMRRLKANSQERKTDKNITSVNRDYIFTLENRV